MQIKENRYIDLFAGCGGLSLGLHNSGWKGIFAIEKSPDAFATLRYNLIDKKNHFDWPAWLPKTNLEIDYVIANYSDQLRKLKGKIDLVAGGPPCQGFSTAGKRQEDDIRNGLIKSYLRFIMLVQPKVILFENVKGFTLKFDKNKSKGKSYSEYILRVLRFWGYDVEGRMIDFSDFGIPQKRTRFILVAIKKDIARVNNTCAKEFFMQLYDNKISFCENKQISQHPDLGHAISDLLKSNGTVETPDRRNFESGSYSIPKSKYQQFLRKETTNLIPDSHSFAKHKPHIIDRFLYFISLGESKKNISNALKQQFKINKHTIIKLSETAKTPTITTLPDDYVHYSEPRILTVREYARIQSFPDWYEFKGKYTTGGKQRTSEVPRYSQIGNAIPPLFGEQSGLALKKIIANEY